MDKLKSYLNQFDIVPTAVKPLAGYVSENYRISDQDGKHWLLKIYRDESEKSLIETENNILVELQNKLNVELSNPIANRNGEYITSLSDGSFCRLLTYIEGTLLLHSDLSSTLLRDFGHQAAQFDIALLDQINPMIAAKVDKWDLKYFSLSKKDVHHIAEPSERKIVDYFIDQFDAHVNDHIQSLRHSVIHNDLNDQNILVEKGRIKGIIDFGDMAYSPLIFESAIAMTYIMLSAEEPVNAASIFLQAYHQSLPLSEQEVRLLYYLVAGRLCTSVISSAKAKAEGVDNDYVLSSEKSSWKLLHYWITQNPIGITNDFLKATDYPIKDVQKQIKYREARRTKLISPAVKMSYDSPIHMQSAAFQYMHDIHGRTYLDAYNNIPHIGHCHPAVTQAISHQARTLNTNTRYHYDSLGEYAEQLLSYFPESLSHVFFVNSGSAASDLSIRLAQNYTDHQQIACIESGYHGNTQIGINISPYKYSGKGGSGLHKQIIELPLPKLYKGQMSCAKDYVEDAISKIEQSLSNGHFIAGFIAEAISGCGGQVPLAPGYIKGMREYLSLHHIPMIIDEVQTGFGRMGSHFWAFELNDIIPDMVVLGKPMGNGHPLAAVVCTQAIAEAFDNGMEFFSSFGGNPVSCEVGKAVISVIEKEGLQQNALEVGQHMSQQLLVLADTYPAIGDVRGHGLFLGVELMDETGEPDTHLAHYVKHYLKDRYILTSTDGKYDNVIKIKPSLCFTKSNADQYCEVLQEALKAY